MTSLFVVGVAHGSKGPKQEVPLKEAVYTLAKNPLVRHGVTFWLIQEFWSNAKFFNNTTANTVCALGCILGAELVPSACKLFMSTIAQGDTTGSSDIIDPNSTKNKILGNRWFKEGIQWGLTGVGYVFANPIPWLNTAAKTVGGWSSKLYVAGGNFIAQQKLTTLGIGMTAGYLTNRAAYDKE